MNTLQDQKDLTQIRREIRVLKMHIDHLDAWIHQARNMVYSLEDKILGGDLDVVDQFLKDWRS